MFGPNIEESREFQCHHREPDFVTLVQEVKSKLFAMTNFDPNEDEIFFITGSATLAIEALFNSLSGEHYISTPITQEFSGRLERMRQHYSSSTESPMHSWWVQYETSISQPYVPKINPSFPGLLIVDAVSSFPFYPIPSEADVAVTVSGKQLGASPGLSIIFLRRCALSYIKPSKAFSYLNLNRYGSNVWPPHTPAVGIIRSLSRTLELTSHLQERIVSRSEKLNNILKDRIGEGPVATYPKETFSEHLSRKWGLYSKNYTQLFLWSGTDDMFEKFTRDIEDGK